MPETLMEAAPSDGAMAVACGWTDGDLDPSAGAHDGDAITRLGIRRAVLGCRPPHTAAPSPAHLSASLGTRFVIAPPHAPSPALLHDLACQGVCGVRFALPDGTDAARAEMEGVLRYTDRIVAHGWHVELALAAGAALTPHEWTLMRLPVAVCVSGVADLAAAHGHDTGETAFLLDLLRLGRTWIRLPGHVAAQDDDDVAAFIRTAADIRPDRLVWGSGPRAPAGHDSGAHVAGALATLTRWLPDAAVRAAVLGANPARLYGFAAAPAPVQAP